MRRAIIISILGLTLAFGLALAAPSDAQAAGRRRVDRHHHVSAKHAHAKAGHPRHHALGHVNRHHDRRHRQGR